MLNESVPGKACDTSSIKTAEWMCNRVTGDVTLFELASAMLIRAFSPSGELAGVPCQSGQLGGSGAGAPAAAGGPRDPEPDHPGAAGRQPPPADDTGGPGRSEGGAPGGGGVWWGVICEVWRDCWMMSVSLCACRVDM